MMDYDFQVRGQHSLQTSIRNCGNLLDLALYTLKGQNEDAAQRPLQIDSAYNLILFNLNQPRPMTNSEKEAPSLLVDSISLIGSAFKPVRVIRLVIGAAWAHLCQSYHWPERLTGVFTPRLYRLVFNPEYSSHSMNPDTASNQSFLPEHI